MDRDEAKELIYDSPLANDAAEISAKLAPSARIILGAESTAAGSFSRFGGMPMLSPGTAWPRWDRRELLTAKIARNEARLLANPKAIGLRNSSEKMRGELFKPPIPLMFLGQLSLSELHYVAELDGWPKKGSLAFFFDSSDTSWGFDPLDRGFCRVLWMDDEDLIPVAAPDDLPKDTIGPARKVAFMQEWTLPTYLTLKGGETSIWRSDEYAELLQGLSSSTDDESIHRAGGHPQEVQGEMRLECQLVTNGLYCGDPTGYNDPRRPELEKAASDWELLFQVDSDDRMNWMWGDAGRLYFWARRQDIRAGDFSNAWAIFQCS